MFCICFFILMLASCSRLSQSADLKKCRDWKPMANDVNELLKAAFIKEPLNFGETYKTDMMTPIIDYSALNCDIDTNELRRIEFNMYIVKVEFDKNRKKCKGMSKLKKVFSTSNNEHLGIRENIPWLIRLEPDNKAIVDIKSMEDLLFQGGTAKYCKKEEEDMRQIVKAKFRDMLQAAISTQDWSVAAKAYRNRPCTIGQQQQARLKLQLSQGLSSATFSVTVTNGRGTVIGERKEARLKPIAEDAFIFFCTENGRLNFIQTSSDKNMMFEAYLTDKCETPSPRDKPGKKTLITATFHVAISVQKQKQDLYTLIKAELHNVKYLSQPEPSPLAACGTGSSGSSPITRTSEQIEQPYDDVMGSNSLFESV